MPTIHRPRRGSLAYSPRKKAKKEVTRIRSWSDQGSVPKVQGFAGYKVGMTHVVLIDNKPKSLTEGMEISVPVTVVESPGMRVLGMRAYTRANRGLSILGEIWSDSFDSALEKKLRVIKNKDQSSGIEKIEHAISEGNVEEIRLIMYTLPKQVSGIPSKVPDVMENRISGSEMQAIYDYGIGFLGKELDIGSIFQEGSMIDVSAITKGKGTQGPVKRWGISLQKRKHSRGGKLRHIGNLGPWHPARVRWTVPQMGQTGYHQRTEFNKQVLKIGNNGEDITPDGGFLHYGEIRNDYLLIKGSIPGPSKRLIRMTDAIRPKKALEGITVPKIIYTNQASKQGC